MTENRNTSIIETDELWKERASQMLRLTAFMAKTPEETFVSLYYNEVAAINPEIARISEDFILGKSESRLSVEQKAEAKQLILSIIDPNTNKEI